MCLPINAENFFTLHSSSKPHTTYPVKSLFSTSKIISSDFRGQCITGLAISGTIRKESPDFLVRILLKDMSGKEYLILESYKENSPEGDISVENYCEETSILDNVIADSIKIIVRGAFFYLNKVTVTNDNLLQRGSSELVSQSKRMKSKQVEAITDRINKYNRAHNKLWIAGKTPLSLKSYEDKKRILGLTDEASTGGLEYYIDGIIEVGERHTDGVIRTNNSPYIDSFDWRNRHGKNWITPNKNQGNSGFCFYFAAVGCAEAMTNLYYNRKLDLDLSEQELACCSNNPNPWNGANISRMTSAMNYLCSHGICDEQAYPFVNDSAESRICRSGEIIPNEQIIVNGYSQIQQSDLSEESLKHALINHGPLISCVKGLPSIYHGMTLVGFTRLEVGDTIYHYIKENHYLDGEFTVSENDPRIGMTVFIYKNSYGDQEDEARGGYWYVIHYDYSFSAYPTFYCNPSITSMNYTVNDIIYEDADGDGYYFWGIGTKPTSCPSWVPDTPDGDDSDYMKGPMDQYGHLQDLSDASSQYEIIYGDSMYCSYKYVYNNIIVESGAKLTVTNILSLYPLCKIIVRGNGELIIDGGSICNAEIDLENGSKLTVKNNGTIKLFKGKNFSAPQGAIVKIESGKIL